jgi:hypothetical protein
MSANLNVSFEIHDFDWDTKSAELMAAAKQFLAAEGLVEPEVLIDFTGQEGYVCGYSTGPIIISNASKWVPDVTERWKAMAARIAGATCRALVDVEYVDEA